MAYDIPLVRGTKVATLTDDRALWMLRPDQLYLETSEARFAVDIGRLASDGDAVIAVLTTAATPATGVGRLVATRIAVAVDGVTMVGSLWMVQESELYVDIGDRRFPIIVHDLEASGRLAILLREGTPVLQGLAPARPLTDEEIVNLS